MNPLTQVKNTQKINAREAALGISESGSWHAKYKDSAYIYAGNFSFDLTEGDLLAIFAQYGEIVDVNLVRDKGTGKSRGFAFLAYEDQRSTVLAVDNLNGASVVGRTIKVDHVAKYKKKEEENEEEEQRKREERGMCRAFQRGECSRGFSCKFSHDEKKSTDAVLGPKDSSRWAHDRYDGGGRKAYKSRGEADGRRENQSMARDFHEKGSPERRVRDEHRLHERERTETSRSGYESEHEKTASGAKRHGERHKYRDKDDQQRNMNNRRDRDGNNNRRDGDENQRKRVTEGKDCQGNEYDDRELTSRHSRDDNRYRKGSDAHEPLPQPQPEACKRSRTSGSGS